MSLPRHIFRAYDIRGIYGKDLTPEVFLRVGAALAKWSDRFCVCSDTRLSSPPLRLALSAGLLGAGASVMDAGEGPIGLAIYLSKHLKYSAGYITASHLPYEWNGLKLYYPGGEPISLDKLNELWRQASGELSWGLSREVRYERVSYLESYAEFLRGLPKESGELRVVVDCGNGATSLIVPKLLRELGYQVVAVNCDVDPMFSVRGSEPTPEATSYLGDLVQRLGGDLGVAFDGDGDRVIFYDERGHALAPEQVAVVMINGHRVKRVVANVECSSLVDRYVESIGGSVERVPVGRIYLIYKALKGVEGLGVESSGHFVTYSGANLDDGITTLLYLLEALGKLGGKLSSHVPPMPLSKRLKFEVGDEKKFEIVEKLKENLASKYRRVTTIDGVRVDLDEGWFLVRPSNTEPVIRVTLEAESTEGLKTLESLVKEELRRAGLSMA